MVDKLYGWQNGMVDKWYGIQMVWLTNDMVDIWYGWQMVWLTNTLAPNPGLLPSSARSARPVGTCSARRRVLYTASTDTEHMLRYSPFELSNLIDMWEGKYLQVKSKGCVQRWFKFSIDTTALRNHMRIVLKDMSSWAPLTKYLGIKATF